MSILAHTTFPFPPSSRYAPQSSLRLSTRNSPRPSSDSQTPTVRLRRLATELRTLRKDSGLTREEVVERTGINVATLYRIEHARVRPQTRTLRTLLDLYGVTPEQQSDLIALLRDARQRGWLHAFQSELPEHYTTYIGFEGEAHSVWNYESLFVPGLLQTEDYARPVIRGGLPTASRDEVERRVEARMERQAVLHNDNPLNLWSIVDEAALRREVGGTAVMQFEGCGWDGAPSYLGTDEHGREVLSYLDGHVAWEPVQPPAVGSDASLDRPPPRRLGRVPSPLSRPDPRATGGTGLGAAYRHVLPFQRATMVLVLPLAWMAEPTAHALLADVAATPLNRRNLPEGSGVGTLRQFLPFHRRIRVFVGPSPLPVAPTAQARLADTAATPLRNTPPPGVGLGTCFHDFPFQRRIRLKPGPHPQLTSPTAQARCVDTAVTPCRKSARPLLASGLGLWTRCHDLPFHAKTRVLNSLLVTEFPTAQAWLADSAVTADRPPRPEGMGACAQVLPFHRSISGLLPEKPTAQASLAETADTPDRLPAPDGLGTFAQVFPFHRAISGLVPVEPGGPVEPTAHTSSAETADTAARTPAPAGPGTRVQALPFQWTISGLAPGEPSGALEPTAHASVADTAATPDRLPVSMGEADEAGEAGGWCGAAAAGAALAAAVSSSAAAKSPTGRVT
jgi:transcriptional regulator with XRE-family HTH domain